jgi:hypothetical protein
VSVFLAPDLSIAVELEPQAMKAMLRVCSRAGGLETGGVLIGRYSRFGDRVVVARVTGAPQDSQRFRFDFIRSTAGLTRRLELAWREGLSYVGERHVHPHGPPRPSGTAVNQISSLLGGPITVAHTQSSWSWVGIRTTSG